MSTDRTEWLARESTTLATEFAGIVGAETVSRYLEEAVAHLDQHAKVDTYITIIARRMAHDRLRQLARAEGLISAEHPEILYVCVHNAGRSQMAAVLTQGLGGDRVTVRSAGSAPASEINPAVREAMAELGYDLSQEFPKPLTDEAVRAADVVITMGCGDACPIYPGKRYLDWQVEDPAGQSVEAVRRIRDDIQGRVETLLAELGITQDVPAGSPAGREA